MTICHDEKQFLTLLLLVIIWIARVCTTYRGWNTWKHQGITNSESTEVIRTECHAVVLNIIRTETSETELAPYNSQAEMKNIIASSVINSLAVSPVAVFAGRITIGNKVHLHSQCSTWIGLWKIWPSYASTNIGFDKRTSPKKNTKNLLVMLMSAQTSYIAASWCKRISQSLNQRKSVKP